MLFPFKWLIPVKLINYLYTPLTVRQVPPEPSWFLPVPPEHELSVCLIQWCRLIKCAVIGLPLVKMVFQCFFNASHLVSNLNLQHNNPSRYKLSSLRNKLNSSSNLNNNSKYMVSLLDRLLRRRPPPLLPLPLHNRLLANSQEEPM